MTFARGAVPAPPLLHVAGVTLQYRDRRRTVTAVDCVDFSVDEGDRVVLLGPSGCGKSSLLKAVAGFLRPSAGHIAVRGREVKGPSPDRVVVFQEFDQLLPWKTVKENVAFPLSTARGMPAREAEAIALEHVARVKLAAFADAYPHTLSGGMKQRVAIARCLALQPEVVLMDEPFAALDAFTRQRMQDDVLELWSEARFTLLFVTHDIAEAVRLGSRILVMSPHPGRVRADFRVGAGTRHEGAPADLQDHIRDLLNQRSEDWTI